jgi:hypothetical protein
MYLGLTSAKPVLNSGQSTIFGKGFEMAGRGGSEFGNEVRKLINSEIETGGNPTWKTVGEKVQKIASKLGDKRDEEKLAAAFGQIKINLKKKDGKLAKSTGKKRGRPPKAQGGIVDNGIVSSGGRVGNGSLKVQRVGNGLVNYDLAIKFAQEAGGLDQAIASLNKLKAIKDSI